MDALSHTVEALLGSDGGGGAGDNAAAPVAAPAAPPTTAAADALAGLLARCSLEASRRQAAAKNAAADVGGHAVEPMEATTSGTASVLAAGDGAATAVCPACGGQVAAARMAVHMERWCPGAPAPPPASSGEPP